MFFVFLVPFVTRLQLQRDVGSEQALNALIQVYKNYYPDVIMGGAGPFKGNIFSVRFDLDGWGVWFCKLTCFILFFFMTV